MLIAFENKKDGTPHLQGCLWRDQKIANKDRQTIKNFFTSKAIGCKGKNFFHLYSARKIESLAAYCNDKEDKGMIKHNVDLDKIKDWKNPKARSEAAKDRCIEWFKAKAKDVDRDLTTAELVDIVMRVSYEMDTRLPPIKSIYYWAQLANVISKYQMAMLVYELNIPSLLDNPDESEYGPEYLAGTNIKL